MCAETFASFKNLISEIDGKFIANFFSQNFMKDSYFCKIDFPHILKDNLL